MPVDVLTTLVFDGPDAVPGFGLVRTWAPVVLALGAIKYYFSGSSNTWERDMHGKVFMVTGGTSGVGASVVRELAQKGAQIILLVRSTEDLWTVEYVEDLREQTNNHLIYAEQCDLADLYLVRKFATRWLDNTPPRRLDGVVCCAGELVPMRSERQFTVDGVERQIGINYLAHFHLLTLLAPSLRVQPPDRDVRVVLCTCLTHALGQVDTSDVLWTSRPYPKNLPWKVYGTSKMMLGLFAREYQRQLDRYERPDKAPVNVRINMVNPGVMRSASTRRFLSFGSVIGLLLYVLMWPLWWLLLKSPGLGMQTLLFALYAPLFKNMEGGQFLQECKIVKTKQRPEYSNEPLQEQLFKVTERHIEEFEKQAAIERKKKETKEEKENRKRAKKAKQADVATKPENLDELEAKLSTLRLGLGMGGGAGDEMPLFPEMEGNKITKRGKGEGDKR